MMSPPLMATSICLVLAEAKTSAGAPWVICVASWSEPAKLKLTVAPLLAALNLVAISLKASVSEAAANTVRSLAPADVAADDVVSGDVAGGVPPQAVSTTMSSARTISQRERGIPGTPFIQQSTNRPALLSQQYASATP